MSAHAKRFGLLFAASVTLAGPLGCKTNKALDPSASEPDGAQTIPSENGTNVGSENNPPGNDGPLANTSPTVDAGPDQVVREGWRVVLEATADDADGDALSAEWEQLAGAPVSLLGAEFPTVEFDAPTVESLAEAMLVFRVTVRDGLGGEASDTVAVRVLLGGDANMDDVVDMLDYRLVKALFEAGGIPGPEGEGDLDLDGRVDGRDLNVVLEDLGRAL